MRTGLLKRLGSPVPQQALTFTYFFFPKIYLFIRDRERGRGRGRVREFSGRLPADQGA